MATKRKSIKMLVEVTVPHWATAAEARAAVRDYLNSSNNWDLTAWVGNDLKEGKLRAKSVRAAPKS